MNKIAAALFVIGWLTIASGVILAFANYEVVVGYEEPLTSFSDAEPIVEGSITVFIIYALAGTVVGIMMFGFAEIVRLLDRILKVVKGDPDPEQEDENKEAELSGYEKFIQETLKK